MDRRDLAILVLRYREAAERLRPVTADLFDVYQEMLETIE